MFNYMRNYMFLRGKGVGYFTPPQVAPIFVVCDFFLFIQIPEDYV